MNKKRQRDIMDIINEAGLQCERLEVTGGSHIAAYLRNPGKIGRKFFFSSTPSDRRGDLNKTALLRRFYRETP